MTRYNDMTEEEKNKYNQKRREKRKLMTSDEREQYLQHRRKLHKALMDAKTPEERLALAKEARAISRTRWELMTPEQRLAEKERHRLRRQNMTPEQMDAERARCRRNVKRLKEDVIRHYSNGTMRCMNPNCEVPGGAKDIDSLTIDHVNGGGRKHAAELREKGVTLYRWLVNNNYPEGYQVLCWNCNNKKRIINKENRHAKKGEMSKRKFFTQTNTRTLKYEKNKNAERRTEEENKHD